MGIGRTGWVMPTRESADAYASTRITSVSGSTPS
jgi:hypothetical protein